MSLFRYPGGKTKLVPEIILRLQACMDSSLQYREPFFGAGTIGIELFEDSDPRIARLPFDSDRLVKSAWINDKDIGIAALWTAVIRHPDALCARIKKFRPSVKQFLDFKEELLTLTRMPKTPKSILDIGFKKLAIHQTSYSGLGTRSGGPLGGMEQKSEYKIGCRWYPETLIKQTRTIHNILARTVLHENACTNVDFMDLIKDTSSDSLIYLDPPYYDMGNRLYQCGMSPQDHERLAEALAVSPHMWMLSYDDCPEIRELYKGAGFIYLKDVNYSITAERTKSALDKVECTSRFKPELLICSNRVAEFVKVEYQPVFEPLLTNPTTLVTNPQDITISF